MCGFAGQFNFDSSDVSKTDIKKMGSIISYRGPDNLGYFFSKGLGLCHRRLSIIDLSTIGNQPMSNEDQSVWIIFNGEISNYIELKNSLKAKGIKFRTESDTEVIIKMYQYYGIKSLPLFNGMFSFVIWDANKNLLLAARDRIGIKPFYYTKTRDNFIFGSEIKAILENSLVKKQQNLEGINNFLRYEHQIDNQTWYKNIYALEPGSYILIVNNHLTINKYWDIQFNVDHNRTFKSFSGELRETVIDAVKINWRSDVPVGAHLSGGIDSSSIVSIASAFTKDIHTFSSAFSLGKIYDERKEINTVANKFKTQHHQITVNEKDILDILPKIIWHLDEPTIGPAIIPMYYISKLIKDNGITVVNGGQGVDEMFAGYPTFYSLAARNILQTIGEKKILSPAEYIYFPMYLKKGGYFNRLINNILKSQKENVSWLRIGFDSHQALEQSKQICAMTQGLDSFEKYTFTRLKYYLPALLQQEDRLSMASSIESRVPLLDNRIVDLALQTPSHFKIRHGVTKAVFRNAMHGIVPREILKNKIKRGYPTPISVWFSGSLYPEISRLLNENNLRSSSFFNINCLKTILEFQRKEPQRNISTPLWKFLVLEMWLRVNFD